jgi:Vitamin K-dependent gamma-carboxylase
MSAHGLDFSAVASLWNSVFHTPRSPLGLAVFRIVFGALLTCESLRLLGRSSAELFSLESLATAGIAPAGYPVTLFSAFGNGRGWIRIVFFLHTVSCMCLTAGFLTRVAAFLVFLNFASRTKQNILATQGGDYLAKMMALLLTFSNAGGALSVDALLHLTWFGGSTGLVSQWAQVLMQIQLSVVYLRSVLWKLRVANWRDGTASFHALYRNPSFRFRKFPPWLTSGPVIALMTWATLLTETAAGILLWFRETRYVMIGIALVFHLSFELFLNLKYFQYLMMACLLLFVPSEAWMHLGINMR